MSAAVAALLRRTQTLNLRYLSTTASHNHEFLTPDTYLNSWAPPRSPKEAEARLAQLRREYAKKVRVVRKEYIQEVELQRLEKKRKDDAKKEAMRVANEERRVAKTESKKLRAKEREVADLEFRQTLMKERAERLEYWKMKVEQVEEKKKKGKEDVRSRSSMWVDEKDLETALLNAVVDVTNL